MFNVQCFMSQLKEKQQEQDGTNLIKQLSCYIKHFHHISLHAGLKVILNLNFKVSI